MQLYQDQSPAAVTRIVYASIHDTLSMLDYKNKNALHPPAVIVVHHLLDFSAILTHLPPASRQGPLSHCQRPFGKKTTTLGYHTTSHLAGHNIC